MPIGGSERPTRRNAARTWLAQSSLFLRAKAFSGGPEGWVGSVLPLQGFALVKKSSLCSGGAGAAVAEHPGWLPPGQHRCGHEQPLPHPFSWLVCFYLGPARGDGLMWLWVGSRWWRVVAKGPVGKEAEVGPGDLPPDGLSHAILPPNSQPALSQCSPIQLPPNILPIQLSSTELSPICHSPTHCSPTQLSPNSLPPNSLPPWVKFPALADSIGQSCPWQLESNVPISQTQTGRFINRKNIQSPSPSKACNLFYSRQPNFI